MRIAVLLTCFNRKEKTLLCLNHLFEIAPGIEIYLVDDGSTDGTSKAIVEQFPKVNIIQGDGSLFWNRGMYLAWREAAKNDYDFYLWLNDDVVLYGHCFKELFDCSSIAGEESIISGLIENETKDETLYGGSGKDKKKLRPNGKLQEITYLNGNVVLVSRSVFNLVGPLDSVFHHDLGDVDYGLRALKKGIKVVTTKTAIAYGYKNNIKRERLNGVGVVKRFQRLYSPLGSNPNINFYFRRKHKSIFNAAGYYVFQHLLNFIPDALNQYVFGNKYA